MMHLRKKVEKIKRYLRSWLNKSDIDAGIVGEGSLKYKMYRI